MDNNQGVDFDSKDLFDRLENIINSIKEKEGFLFIILPLKKLRENIDELIKDAIELQAQLIRDVIPYSEYFEIKRKVVDCERRSTQIMERLWFLPVFSLLYFSIAMICFIVFNFNIPAFVVQKLGVAAPERLITLGVCGAFLQLATNLMKSREEKSIKASHFLQVFENIIRLSMAIVVPIVLVMLFFNQDGTFSKLIISPELVSFACGYSSNLVVEILNKIVEKGRLILKTI